MNGESWAIEDTWRSIWEAYALTDPRSTVGPSVAVERHKKWCDDHEDTDSFINTHSEGM